MICQLSRFEFQLIAYLRKYYGIFTDLKTLYTLFMHAQQVDDVGKTFHLEGMHFFHTKLAKYWQDLHVCKGSFPQVNGVLLMPKCQNVTSLIFKSDFKFKQKKNLKQNKTKKLLKLFLCFLVLLQVCDSKREGPAYFFFVFSGGD